MHDIRTQIDHIINGVEKEKIDTYSLYSGVTGSLLFKTFYNLHVENNKIDINNELELLIDNSLENKIVSMSNGKTGINWFFSYLKKMI